MKRSNYNGVLVIFHCPEDTGYAIKSLEESFLQAGRRMAGDNVHFSYTEIRNKKTSCAPKVIRFDPTSNDKRSLEDLSAYIADNNIDFVLGFDQAPGKKYYKYLRRSGVKRIVSYWGASISDVNTGLKLQLKRLEMRLRKNSPDLYVFESEAMRYLAVHGRGVDEAKTMISHLGVDTEKFKPNDECKKYPYVEFDIPVNRKIFYYSGHMEPRKGVSVIINAAIDLFEKRNFRGFHFLLLGNRNGEEAVYEKMLSGSGAKDHVTFGGYRNDIALILPGCYLGVIASTGWDSFTMSSLEVAASGLPLLVSNLQGLAETVEDGVTGYVFSPGNHLELAEKLVDLSENGDKRNIMAEKSRERVLSEFSKERQVETLYEIFNS